MLYQMWLFDDMPKQIRKNKNKIQFKLLQIQVLFKIYRAHV